MTIKLAVILSNQPLALSCINTMGELSLKRCHGFALPSLLAMSDLSPERFAFLLRQEWLVCFGLTEVFYGMKLSLTSLLASLNCTHFLLRNVYDSCYLLTVFLL
jgi:hypothetical protein